MPIILTTQYLLYLLRVWKYGLTQKVSIMFDRDTDDELPWLVPNMCKSLRNPWLSGCFSCEEGIHQNFPQDGIPSDVCWFMFTPWILVRYICTNLSNELGHHLAKPKSYLSRPCCSNGPSIGHNDHRDTSAAHQRVQHFLWKSRGDISGLFYHQMGGFHKWRYPNSWMVDFDGKSKTQMDDFGKPPGNL